MSDDQALRAAPPSVEEASVGLERDLFLRTLLRHLAGALERVSGHDDASRYISMVGGAMGKEIGEAYRNALQVERLDRAQVTEVLVDLKRRIQGDFYVVSEDDRTIVLGNRACPFGDKVVNRPSLCMMTSNVFGSIAASNLGYARVELQETIARGATGCRIAIHLRPPTTTDAEGREYYSADR